MDTSLAEGLVPLSSASLLRVHVRIHVLSKSLSLRNELIKHFGNSIFLVSLCEIPGSSRISVKNFFLVKQEIHGTQQPCYVHSLEGLTPGASRAKWRWEAVGMHHSSIFFGSSVDVLHFRSFLSFVVLWQVIFLNIRVDFAPWNIRFSTRITNCRQITALSCSRISRKKTPKWSPRTPAPLSPKPTVSLQHHNT